MVQIGWIEPRLDLLHYARLGLGLWFARVVLAGSTQYRPGCVEVVKLVGLRCIKAAALHS